MLASTDGRRGLVCKARKASSVLLVYVYLSALMASCSPSGAGGLAVPSAASRSSLDPSFAQNYQLAPPALNGAKELRAARSFAMTVSSDGELQASIPLLAPPGRLGIEPRLSLKYGHRRGSGVAGDGWSLDGLGRVHRCSKTKALDGEWGESGGAALCLDGARLVSRSSSQFATVDGEQLGVSVQGSFVFRRRDGVVSTYGHTIGSSSNPAAWLQTKIADAWGNSMLVSYSADGEPNQIEYTKEGSGSGNRFVDFSYEEPRVRARSEGVGGELVVHAKRLKRVTMSAPANIGGQVVIVRRYHLQYSPGTDRLERVSECVPDKHSYGRTDQPIEMCFAPIAIAYDGADVAFGPKVAVGGGWAISRDCRGVED